MKLPPSPGPVDELFRNYHEIRAALTEDGVTIGVTFDTQFRKLLVLSAASHLEALMSFHMHEYFENLGDTPYQFVRRLALERKFFQWFDFDSPMPTKFFKLFGATCHSNYDSTLAAEPTFEAACKSFISICATRNTMVHQNLVLFAFEQTPIEIERMFREAIEFPDLAIRCIKASL